MTGRDGGSSSSAAGPHNYEWTRRGVARVTMTSVRATPSAGSLHAPGDVSTTANQNRVGEERRTLEPARGGDHEEDEQEEARAEADRGHDVVAVALDGARPARGGAYRLLCPGDAAYGR